MQTSCDISVDTLRTSEIVLLQNVREVDFIKCRCPISIRWMKHFKKIRTLNVWNCKIWQRGSLNCGVGIGVVREKFLCRRGFSSWYKVSSNLISVYSRTFRKQLWLIITREFMDKSAVPWYVRSLSTILYIVTCSLLNSACFCPIALRILFFHWTFCLPLSLFKVSAALLVQVTSFSCSSFRQIHWSSGMLDT